MKDKGVQTEMVLDRTLKEMEYFIRICRTLYPLRIAKELYGIGKTECPDLEQEVLKGIITAHYPVGQSLDREMEDKERGDLNRTLPPSSAECEEDFDDGSAKSSKEQTTTVEEDLQLSDTDDDSSLVLVYTSSEED